MCEKLSLQGLWYHLQPTLRLFALLERLVAILSKTHSVTLTTIFLRTSFRPRSNTQTSDDGCGEQVGGALLNVVHTQAVAIGAGRGGASGGGAEDETRGVLHYLLQSACAPFFEILGCWIYEGNHPTFTCTLSAPYSFA